MVSGKKILIAHNWSDNSYAAQSKKLAIEFSKSNKVVFINALKRNLIKEKINENLDIMEWAGKRPTGFKDFLFVKKLIQKFKPDITISHFGAVNFTILASWLANVAKRICYYHTLTTQNELDVHKPFVVQQLQVLRKKMVYRLATHVVCVSEAARQDLIINLKVNEKKLRVLHNAIPPSPVVNTASTLQFGFVGRLNYSKGVDILINAFETLINKGYDITLAIAGNGSDENQLLEMVSQKKLTNKITFLGKLPYLQIAPFLAGCYCMVLPSRSDNLPTVVIEAMSTKTPVIAARVGGVAELIKDGENGLLFSANDVAGLANAMEQLINNNHLRTTLAINALASFNNNYSIENYTDRFCKIFI